MLLTNFLLTIYKLLVLNLNQGQPEANGSIASHITCHKLAAFFVCSEAIGMLNGKLIAIDASSSTFNRFRFFMDQHSGTGALSKARSVFIKLAFYS
jgi:hypothetical protein